MNESIIEIRDDSEARQLFGKHDETLRNTHRADVLGTVCPAYNHLTALEIVVHLLFDGHDVYCE